MANEGVQSAFARYSLDGNKLCFERIRSKDRALIIDHSARMNCGTRAHSANDQSPGPMSLGYTVFLEPTPEEFDIILPKIGFTKVSTNWVFSTELVPAFDSQIDRVVTVRSYTGCRVNRAQFYSSTGQPLILALDVVAMGYSDGAQNTFSGSAVTGSSTPYVHNQAEMTTGGTARKFSSFMYAVNNRIFEEHNNAALPTNLDPADRIEQVQANFPANSEHQGIITNDWGTTRTDGVTGFAKYTRGTKSLQISWESLKADGAQPDIPMRGREIRFQQTWSVYKTTTSSTTIVNTIS